MHNYVFSIGHQIISYTETSHTMSVRGNGTISPNDCDATPLLNIYTIPRTPAQADSISDVSEPPQGPSYPYTANLSSEEYGLIS